MTVEDYLIKISKRSDRYGSQLLRLMEEVNVDCLLEITLEQAKDFYEKMVEQNIDDSVNIEYGKFYKSLFEMR